MEDFAEEPEEAQAEDSQNLEPTRDVESESVCEPQWEMPPTTPFPSDSDSMFPDLMDESEDYEEFSSAENGVDERGQEVEEDPEGDKDDHPAILRIDESLLARVNQVFVEPHAYRYSNQRLLEQISDNYIFVVYGHEHAGKLACALHLAQDLLDRKGSEKKIYCYRHRLDESPSLLEFVRQDYVRQERAYILEDAFPSVSKEDLATPFLHLLNDKLREKRSFLLLTTENPVGELPAGVAAVQAEVSDLRQVFINHLALYETDESTTDRVRIEKPVLDLALENWDALKESLKDPDQIDEFCRRLGVQGGLPQVEGLRNLAQEIALRRIEAARPWFGNLLAHEKLFAFLVVLFPGRDGLSLYEIFLNFTMKLRDQGMNLTDPRRVGYNDLLDRVRALEGPTREIGFHERAIGAEVEWQIKNYNHLLWSLVPWLLEEIQSSLGLEALEIRRSRAVAVGRIGFHHPKRLREVLEKLASHSSDKIATSVGHALSEVCSRARDADQEVCDALRAWVASGNPRLLWTAASCIWRVYGSLTRSSRNTSETRTCLLETLEELIAVSEAKGLGSDSALFAVKKIAVVDPKGMVERLRLWLTEGGPDLRRMSERAIHGLFEGAVEPGARKRRPVLIELIEPVLAHCGERSTVTASLFSTLAKWMDEPEATAALLKAANRLTDRAARAFRAGLAPWLANHSPKVRRLGGALLTRSLVLEGAAVPALSALKGVLVLDASTEVQGDVAYELVARRIWNLLQPRLNLRLVRMGEGRELAGPGQLFPSRIVLANGSRPRLLLPAVNAVSEEDLSVVIILATGPIVDLEEVSMAAWSSALLLTNLGKTSRDPFASQAIRIDPRSPAAGLVDLVARIDETFVAAIAGAAGGWLDEEDVETRLSQWVHELDQPQSLNGSADQVVAILQAVLGLAESDLDRCSTLLSSWLAPDRSDLELRMGSASVRLLLRITVHRSAPSSPARARLFNLATALGACGPEGLEAAFSAIRNWLSSPEWTKTLLDHTGNEPAPFLLWLETLLPQKSGLLSRVLADWRTSSSDESSDAARRLIEATERIEEYIANRASDSQEQPTPIIDPEPSPQIDHAPLTTSRMGVHPSNTTDPLGFPMVWIEEIGAFIHWLPVTKVQFEKFIAATPDPLFDDAWYRRILDLNPRVGSLGIGPKNYWNAFLTGILPEEARRFATWCGHEYSLPTLKEWQKAFATLSAVPAASAEISSLVEGTSELVRSTLVRIESSSAASGRPDRQRMRADQMLMRSGVLEWVDQTLGAARWGGMGEPCPHFRMLWSVARGAVNPLDADRSRSPAFGFRLIRRMDPTRFISKSQGEFS